MRYPTTREARRPTPDSLERIEQAARRIEPTDPAVASWYRDYASRARMRLAFDLDLIGARVPRPARIIEVGSVPLLLTAALADLGYAVHGVDLAPQRFADAISALGLEVAATDVERAPLPFPDASFDVALFNELFEHLRIDPIFTMGEVRRVLRPQGRLLLSTPNLLSLHGWVSLVLRGRPLSDIYTEYEKLRTLGHMGHVREYAPAEVCRFLEQVGFGIEEVVWRGGYRTGPRWRRGLAGAATAALPRLRPFVSVIGRAEPG